MGEERNSPRTFIFLFLVFPPIFYDPPPSSSLFPLLFARTRIAYYIYIMTL